LAVAAMAFTASAQEKEWNISNWEAADYTAETTIDGFTIYATEAGKVSVDASKKKVDGVQYTMRLKTGGAGSRNEEGVLSRVLSFDVPSAGTVSFLACSSNSSDNRVCGVTFGEFVGFPVADEEGNVPPTPEAINTLDVLAGNPVEHTVAYSGEATKVYIFSKTGGINFYDFKFVPGSGESGLAAIAADAEAPVYYNLQGMMVENPTSGLYICKQGSKVTKVIL
ncbi:MAG: hypothetical protein K2H87_03040, partial [Duncaniella sp.]|nr:hypothetical protein [Duncaniella sp.]